jgi:MYXO-CTERM domain-containing protein
MGINKKLVSLGVATVIAAMHAVPTLANVQTWDFNSGSQSFNNSNFGNSISLTSSDGVNLKITGWSDTNDVSGDDTVETAKLLWANTNALGAQNQDEDTSDPNHSVDSVTSDSDGDFDMLLLEFDTAVNLTSLKLNWAVGGNSSNTADLSILAWDGTGSAALAGKTWSSILDSNGGRYDSVGNYSNVGLSYYTVNPTSIESTKWLVGVYNPVFGSGGDAGDDGFKLASLKTSTSSTPPPTPTPVPVPGTAGLILAGLLALRTRRSLKLKAK